MNVYVITRTINYENKVVKVVSTMELVNEYFEKSKYLNENYEKFTLEGYIESTNEDSGPWLTNGNNDFPQNNTYETPWESMGS